MEAIVGATYTFKTGLIDAINGGFKLTPTIAAGDFKISTPSIGGGALTNLTNLPTESPAGSGIVVVVLTSGEMADGDPVVKWKDQTTPAEWMEGLIHVVSMASSVASRASQSSLDTAATNRYQAKVWLIDDNSGLTDRYMVCWFKNGEPIVAGITSPTIQVIKSEDGTDLVASTALTQIGSTGLYKKDETSNLTVVGAAYVAKVSSTIDAGTRTWYQPIGRDS